MVNASFSRNLAVLRKDKSVSQKKAAADLGLSQALLSHYENGIREPGFDFVLRAADYYECSVDYLLGRTNDRRGIAYLPEEYEAEHPEEYLYSEINRITGAISTLAEHLALTENEKLLSLSMTYMKLFIYRLTRLVSFGSEKIPGHFKLSDNKSAALSSALIAICEEKLSEQTLRSPSDSASGTFRLEQINGWRDLSAIIAETEEAAQQLSSCDFSSDL
ncbi:MAG: helix-turn-helix domain-containing protein [Eubacteriales bacterium]